MLMSDSNATKFIVGSVVVSKTAWSEHSADDIVADVMAFKASLAKLSFRELTEAAAYANAAFDPVRRTLYDRYRASPEPRTLDLLARMSPVEILDGMLAFYANENGWTQGQMHIYDGVSVLGSRCLMGAVQAVTSYSMVTDMRTPIPAIHVVCGLLATVIREQYPDRILDVPAHSGHGIGVDVIMEFNDHDDTTLDDVTAVLEKARLRAEEEL
jgi:hypothetical protein